MMKLMAACALTLLILSTPVLGCGTQLNPEPCQAAAEVRQPAGQFIAAPRFRPLPAPRARVRGIQRRGGS
jgi:hypothetical protein